MRFTLRVNETGELHEYNFRVSDFSNSVTGVSAAAGFVNGFEPTREQALHQISIWNRAQENYRREFSYFLSPAVDVLKDQKYCDMCSMNPVIPGTVGCKACTEYAFDAVKAAECPQVTKECIPDIRSARDVLMAIVDLLDTYPLGPVNTQEALKLADQWLDNDLEDNPEVQAPVKATDQGEEYELLVHNTMLEPGDEVLDNGRWVPTCFVRTMYAKPDINIYRRKIKPVEVAAVAEHPTINQMPLRLWVNCRIESERGDWAMRCAPAYEELNNSGRSQWLEIKAGPNGFYVEPEGF